METIDRVTPDRIEAAYKACGMTPIQGVSCMEYSCCPLAAVAIAEKGVRVEAMIVDVEAMFRRAIAPLKLSSSYISGFVEGFDEPNGEPSFSSADHMNGRADGIAAAIRMGLYSPEDVEE